MYSSTLCSNSALDVVGGHWYARAVLRPGKDPVPILQEAKWALGLVWKDAENIALTRIRSPDRATRNESLYRLSYSGPQSHCNCLSVCVCVHMSSQYFAIN